MKISIEQATGLVLGHTSVLEEEQTPLEDSINRVLVRDIYSAIDQPPFDRSPLDGYGVISSDIEGASHETPVVLKVVDKLYAGMASDIPVLKGQAVRLMTGSMIPKGADCIIRQEDTDLGEQYVSIYRSLKADSNYCHIGEEYEAGAVLLKRRLKIDAAAIAVAAGAGLTSLPVRRHVRAAVISTGDEICRPGEKLPPGKIYDSNVSYLSVRLSQLGAVVTERISVEDNVDKIAALLERVAAGNDLVITTGGVSVGQRDLMEKSMEAAGAEIVFHGIDMKPGMPTLIAVKGRTLFLGLSGNPFSAAVPFELLVRPMFSKMLEDPSLELKKKKARAANDFTKRSPSRRFLRACFQNGVVYMPQKQGNGQMQTMVGCNCLIDIPAGTDEVWRGNEVNMIRI